MAIPTPPTDQSGGFFILKVASARGSHRMRFHVDVFNADAARLAYTAPAAGQEADVLTTVANVAAQVQIFYNNAWTISLDSVWQSVPAAPAQSLPQFTPFVPVPGTGTAASNTLEAFYCVNFKTVRGGRARFFLIDPGAWTYQSKQTLTMPGAPGSWPGILTEFTGASTGVRGHDGSKLVLPATQTAGVNKRLRRKVGNS